MHTYMNSLKMTRTYDIPNADLHELEMYPMHAHNIPPTHNYNNYVCYCIFRTYRLVLRYLRYIDKHRLERR